MIKILTEIDPSPYLELYYVFESQIQWQDYGHKGKQAGLQYKKFEDPFKSAVGKSKGVEYDYDILNPMFLGTIFENLILEYKLKRTRLMWLGSNSAYSFHKDPHPRIHLPLVSNSNSYLIFKNGLIENLKVGNLYWTDTREEHTAINGDHNWRLHLIGSVIS